MTIHDGSVIGRLPSAALQIADPRISEAHALVSLRGDDVKLLALRGRFAVDGVVCTSTVLEPGLEVELARGIPLKIVEVYRPTHRLGIALDGGAAEVLAGVTSIYGGAHPHMKPGWNADAGDVLWHDGDGWIRASDEATVASDTQWSVDGCVVHAIDLPLRAAPDTVVDTTFAAPLTITVEDDRVHVHQRDECILSLKGVHGRIVQILSDVAQPVDWWVISREVWGDLNKPTLRKRWDMTLYRIRKKCRDAGIRVDLVSCGGGGLAELRLRPDDTLVQR